MYTRISASIVKVATIVLPLAKELGKSGNFWSFSD
jgi:hypothetical protein